MEEEDLRRAGTTGTEEFFVRITPAGSSDYLRARDVEGACARKMEAWGSRKEMKGVRLGETEPLLTPATLFIGLYGLT